MDQRLLITILLARVLSTYFGDSNSSRCRPSSSPGLQSNRRQVKGFHNQYLLIQWKNHGFAKFRVLNILEYFRIAESWDECAYFTFLLLKYIKTPKSRIDDQHFVFLVIGRILVGCSLVIESLYGSQKMFPELFWNSLFINRVNYL